MPQVGVLRVHVLHAQPGGLPQLVPPPQVTLAPEVESLVLVVSSPADQLRHVGQADGGGGAAGGDAAQGLVGWAGGGGAGRGVWRGPGVLHAGQSVVAGTHTTGVGMARGEDSQRVVDHFMTRTIESIVSGGHEVMELGGRRAHPLGPQSEGLHVRELDLARHLEGLQVEVPDVEALVGLHHGVGDQAVQAGAGDVWVQCEAGRRDLMVRGARQPIVLIQPEKLFGLCSFNIR